MPMIESGIELQLVDNNDELHLPSDSPQPEKHHLFMEHLIPLHHSLASPDMQSMVATQNAMVANIFSKSQGAALQVSNINIDRNKSNNKRCAFYGSGPLQDGGEAAQEG